MGMVYIYTLGIMGFSDGDYEELAKYIYHSKTSLKIPSWYLGEVQQNIPSLML